MDLVVPILVILLIVVGVLLLLRIMRPLPDRSTIEPSTALPPATDSPLAKAIAREQQEHPGQTGIIALAEGHDALASRLVLAQQATRSIDAQYYIWKDDAAGRLLLHALYQASLRGCRVRLLLDDNGIEGMEQWIATLDAQPGFEVRIFNPSTTRHPKLLGFAYDFFRMNRRMHNKSFTVDGLASIIGGRNIGDEYFRIGDANFFLDLDAIALGTVVQDTSAAFDRYWNSASVYPASLIVDHSLADLPAFQALADAARADPQTTALLSDLADSTDRLIHHSAAIEWTGVQLFVDDPAKGQGKARQDALMITKLAQILGTAQRGIHLVSAYFIPGRQGSRMFEQLAQHSVNISILTNAFATTDVKAVHSGYIKYRRPLLKAGVHLYELMPGQAPGAGKPKHFAGSGSASLHAKTFAIDNTSIFIGSFNFDPRSAHLNCEMGFLIDSHNLASQLSGAFSDSLPYGSFQPRLTDNGKMVWVTTARDGTERTESPEPATSGLDRLIMRFMALLPIERWL